MVKRSFAAKKKKPEKGIKYYLQWAWVPILGWLIYSFIVHRMENLRLVNHGKFAMGNVTDQWRGKSPATVYLFDVNGHFYSGSVKIVAGYAIGDSIVVVYDPGDPDLNRPYRYLQENFDMPLHSDSTLPR